MKIIYAGSPEYALRPLTALIQAGYEIVAVLTQPDRPVGRRRTLTPTPVKAYALSKGIPVFDFERVRDHVKELAEVGADIMFTCAYGQILTKELLNAFPMGVYNLHASLLPKFRGASPIQSAILAGEEYTGVTVMRTEIGLDCGDILLVKRCPVDGMTCGELSERLSVLSAEAALDAAKILSEGVPSLLVQDDSAATHCKKISKADARADFSLPAQRVANIINAFSPSPMAYAMLSGSPVNFLKAHVSTGNGGAGEVLSADKSGVEIACGSGSVVITALQFAGGKVISAADAVNGRKIKAGDRFE